MILGDVRLMGRGYRQRPYAPLNSARFLPPSSRGLGRRPLTAETGVRIPVAVLANPALAAGVRRLRAVRVTLRASQPGKCERDAARDHGVDAPRRTHRPASGLDRVQVGD